MILTVTINPLLERRYYYSALDFSTVNRNGKVIIKAGGKGINVNRQLNKFGIQNVSLLFTGGTNGKLIREALHNEKINFSGINTKSETRDATIIINQTSDKVYSFFGSDSIVAPSEVENFVSKMEKMIATCEIVVFSGSSPCKETDLIFVEGITIANKMDKISVCDTYGKHLQYCLDASPTIIHNNADEIIASLGFKLDDESYNLKLLNTLYSKGIKQGFITNAEKPLYASNFDFHYKVTLPKINTVDSTGSGDAFVAGIVYGWHRKLNFEQQLRFAAALGVCNSKSVKVCEVESADANSIAEKIKIKSIGKKLKVIDDSLLSK